MSILYHYVYKISFSSGKVYYGVRSCVCLPEKDVNYLGSPKTHKNYWDSNIACKEVLATFDSREEAASVEVLLIERQWELDKECSLNANIAATTFNILGTKRENFWLHSPYLFISPSGQIFEGKNIFKFCNENNLDKRTMWNIQHNPTGYYHSYKGWTTNFYNYLSLKFYGYCNQNLPKPIYLYHAKHGKQKMFSQIKFIEKWGIKHSGNFSRLVQGKLKYVEGWVLEKNRNHKIFKADSRRLVCQQSNSKEEAFLKITQLEPNTSKRTLKKWLVKNWEKNI